MAPVRAGGLGTAQAPSMQLSAAGQHRFPQSWPGAHALAVAAMVQPLAPPQSKV
jgi:hypothetical protein